jgi:hypothetical protein
MSEAGLIGNLAKKVSDYVVYQKGGPEEAQFLPQGTGDDNAYRLDIHFKYNCLVHRSSAGTT